MTSLSDYSKKKRLINDARFLTKMSAQSLRPLFKDVETNKYKNKSLNKNRSRCVGCKTRIYILLHKGMRFIAATFRLERQACVQIS